MLDADTDAAAYAAAGVNDDGMSFDISCHESASQKEDIYWQKCSKLLKCVRRL